MKVHIASETQYMIQGNGVHTAFVDHVDLMKSKQDVDVVVNNEGVGDVFHCHTYGPYYFLKGLFYKGRRVHTVHVIPESIKGSLPMWKLLMPLVKWYFKQVYSYADVCIAISPRVEEAIKETGAKTEIVRVYNPIPTERWKSSPKRRAEGRRILGIADDEFVVLGVGQLQARKGVEEFMDVAEAIPGARFVWAGGRPFKAMTEGIARIDKRIANVTANVQFAGMFDLDTMPLIYAAADMLLFPSTQENCPLAPIEAAACGLPVVFRDLKEYRSLYEHPYLNGIYINDFVGITRRMMTDKHYYANAVILSENLVKQFDKHVVRKKLLALYQRLSNSITNAMSLSV
ncbi:MAG: glycosyltransferase [Bacteroidales bacterium]|nr:glycosyltransferase [Bacteroidales bacterium]